jgi:hypothetical protein
MFLAKKSLLVALAIMGMATSMPALSQSSEVLNLYSARGTLFGIYQANRYQN